MAGKKQETVETDERVMMYKQELVVLRSVLREKMEREYDEKSADIQFHIDTIAYSYAQQGESVAKIAKRIGTTNWKTASECVARAKSRMGVAQKMDKRQNEAFTVTLSGTHRSGLAQYVVHTDPSWVHGAHVAKFYVQPQAAGLGGMVIPEGPEFYDLDEDTTTPLHSELRDNWTTSPIADRVRQMEEN